MSSAVDEGLLLLQEVGGKEDGRAHACENGVELWDGGRWECRKGSCIQDTCF